MIISVTEPELELILSGLEMLGEYLNEEDQNTFNNLMNKLELG